MGYVRCMNVGIGYAWVRSKKCRVVLCTITHERLVLPISPTNAVSVQANAITHLLNIVCPQRTETWIKGWLIRTETWIMDGRLSTKFDSGIRVLELCKVVSGVLGPRVTQGADCSWV